MFWQDFWQLVRFFSIIRTKILLTGVLELQSFGLQQTEIFLMIALPFKEFFIVVLNHQAFSTKYILSVLNFTRSTIWHVFHGFDWFVYYFHYKIKKSNELSIAKNVQTNCNGGNFVNNLHQKCCWVKTWFNRSPLFFSISNPNS